MKAVIDGIIVLVLIFSGLCVFVGTVGLTVIVAFIAAVVCIPWFAFIAYKDLKL